MKVLVVNAYIKRQMENQAAVLKGLLQVKHKAEWMSSSLVFWLVVCLFF